MNMYFDDTLTSDKDRANLLNWFNADDSTPAGAVPTLLDEVTGFTTDSEKGSVACDTFNPVAFGASVADHIYSATISIVGTAHAGTNMITGIASTSGILVDMPIWSAAIGTVGMFVTGVTPTTLTLSQVIQINGAQTFKIAIDKITVATNVTIQSPPLAIGTADACIRVKADDGSLRAGLFSISQGASIYACAFGGIDIDLTGISNTMNFSGAVLGAISAIQNADNAGLFNISSLSDCLSITIASAGTPTNESLVQVANVLGDVNQDGGTINCTEVFGSATQTHSGVTDQTGSTLVADRVHGMTTVSTLDLTTCLDGVLDLRGGLTAAGKLVMPPASRVTAGPLFGPGGATAGTAAVGGNFRQRGRLGVM